MTESYLLHKNLHYNGLMSDLGLTPHAHARKGGASGVRSVFECTHALQVLNERAIVALFRFPWGCPSAFP